MSIEGYGSVPGQVKQGIYNEITVMYSINTFCYFMQTNQIS